MLQKTNVIRGVGTLIALLAVSTCWAATNSMTFTNVSGGSISNYPMQFGRQFVQGEIPNYPQAKVDGSAVTTQANVQTRWGDGSVKHVIITFILAGPIANNGTATFTFQNQAGCNCGSGVHETRANMLNTGTYDFDASVGNGTVTMSARAMVTAWDGTTVGPTGMQYWVDGSIATTLLIADHSTARAFDFGNDANKSLRPLFYCTFWPSLSKVKVRFIVENTNTQTIQDQIWNVILKTGNASPATVYTKSSIPQTAATRWTKSFWIGGAPTELYDLDHNLSYLKTTFAVPNYDTAKTVTPTQVAADYSAWASKAKDIYDAGNWQKIMNSGGGRPDIGPFPTWSVNWLYTGDHREREIALVNADLAGAWAMHFREGDPGKFMDKAQTVPALGRMPSISARPTLSFNQMYTEASTSIGDKITPVGTACDPHAGGGNYTVTGASWSPAVATITIGSGHKIVQNQVVTISSLNPSGYNGTVTVTGVTATTFTYALASDPGGPRISGGSVKVGTCTWNWDAAHILSCFTVPYLLTGDYFYLEQQWIWTGFTAAYTPYGSADNGRGLVGSDAAVYRGELRAIAWELRERFEAGNISPDGTAEKALINAWIDDTLAALDGAENLTDSFYNGNPLWNWGRTKVSTNAFFQAPIMPMPLGQFWKGGNGLAVSNVTTITAPVDATQTNVTLASATPFSAHPVDATHQFCAVIDQGTGQVERVRVRARVGTTFTIARGFYGTQVTYGVTAASWVGSTATYTIGAPHDVQVGHLVTISGATPSGYNISNAPVTAISGTTISITMASDPHAWSNGGVAKDTSISLTSCNSNASGSAFPHASGAVFYESSQSGYGIYAPNVYEANSAFEFAYFCYAVGRGAELGYHSDTLIKRPCARWYNNVINDPAFNPNLVVAGRMPTTKFSDHTFFATMAELKTGYYPTLADAQANGAVTGSPLCYRWKDTACVDLSDPQNAYPILGAAAISFITPYTGGAAAWTWALANIESATDYGGNPKWALLPRAFTCSIVNISCPDGHIGTGSYGCNLEQVGCSDSSSWTILAGTLPSWASITSDAGVIFGSPSGSSPSTAMFTAAYDTATQPLTITTCTLPAVITASPLTDAVQNQAYTPLQITGN